ncbi:MAG: phosphoglucomutase/phosphomannomutase family protein [Vampirovibrionales bacterium]
MPSAASLQRHPISFGTDGWRAIMAKDFTFDNVTLVVRAIHATLLERWGNQDKPVFVGYDGRFLGKQFAHHAAEVLTTLGWEVWLVPHYTPTPIVAFAARHYNTAGALMLTASHNPPEYMGLKFIPEYAGPATQDITDTIVRHVDRLFDEGSVLALQPKPGACQVVDPYPEYVAFLRQSINFKALKGASISLLYDSMYGAGGGYFDRLLKEEADIKPTLLRDRVDPSFGGHLPEPNEAHLGELKACVVAQGAHVGLANDGDADRFGVVDETGRFLGANQIIPMLARYLYHHKGLRGSVVRSVATSRLLDALAAQWGLTCHETKVGFKHMGAVMRAEPVMIGGEEAGGLSIQTHIPEKDGLLANLLILEMMAVEGKPLSQILLDTEAEAGVHLVGLAENLHLSDTAKQALMATMRGLQVGDCFAGRPIEAIVTLDGVKLLLNATDWILVRPSGTEPIIRVYGETTDAMATQQLKAAMEAMVASCSA